MSATAERAGVWDETPLTKFRIPRVRRDAIARPELVARLSAAVDDTPITVVSAPGGYGKSTLLAQFATESASRGPKLARAIVWIAIDGDDNDTHRLFASMLRAVEPLNLAWEAEPRSLLSNAAGSPSQQRAALAALVNALCTSSSRIVMVFDDFHRVESGEALALIEAFIERLPDHVSIVIGTRKEPDLPLARWRVHGELLEFVPRDLEFSESEALALAMARLGAAAETSLVLEALRRTHGWAAGLSMVLQSRPSASAVERMQTGAGEVGDRHLFAYLAQEILAELPEELRDFALQCSILSELSPQLCRAVTGCDNAGEILNELYRRNLFLTAIDESTPVLRFHDLFRDFLSGELQRRQPEALRELHRRAGQAEGSTSRVVAHYLSAQCWPEAVERITLSGEAMLIEGGHALLERWIDSIPADVRARFPVIVYLRGICAWLRWDWPRAKQEFGAAVIGLDPRTQAIRRLRCLFMYVDALNSSGDAASAGMVLDEIGGLDLDDVGRAQLALQRAWHAFPLGEPDRVGRHHEEFVAEAELNPTRVCPATADLIHCLCIGVPRVARSFDRYYALTEQVHTRSTSPWKFAALAVGLWARFWQGRREEVDRLLELGAVMQQQFGTIRLVAERLTQFKALYLGSIGDTTTGIAMTNAVIRWLHTPEAAGHRAAWLRGYLHGLARLHWMAMDRDAHAKVLPQLLGPRGPAEWPFIDAATETARGQAAVLAKDWSEAIACYERAVPLHERFRMPATYADPRVGLAYAYLMSGDRSKAAGAFESVYLEATTDRALGLLLLEPRSVVAAILENLPAETRRTPEYQMLLSAFSAWNSAHKYSAASGPLHRLSDREIEVLAQVAAGASNKHIARDLSLSLHTVKRHIANILDKLDCASRGQAADLYRRYVR